MWDNFRTISVTTTSEVHTVYVLTFVDLWMNNLVKVHRINSVKILALSYLSSTKVRCRRQWEREQLLSIMGMVSFVWRQWGRHASTYDTQSLNLDLKQGIMKYGHPQYSGISYLLSPTNTLPHTFFREFHVVDVQKLHTTSWHTIHICYSTARQPCTTFQCGIHTHISQLHRDYRVSLLYYRHLMKFYFQVPMPSKTEKKKKETLNWFILPGNWYETFQETVTKH